MVVSYPDKKDFLHVPILLLLLVQMITVLLVIRASDVYHIKFEVVVVVTLLVCLDIYYGANSEADVEFFSSSFITLLFYSSVILVMSGLPLVYVLRFDKVFYKTHGTYAQFLNLLESVEFRYN